MNKTATIIIAVVSTVIGAAIGTNASRYFARQHERTTAVMVMLDLHQHRWESAISDKNCEAAANELHSLQWLAREISVVLPLADQQDAVFHEHVQKMNKVLSLEIVSQCPAAIATIKQVRDVCDECHRDYR
jgi:hypothetical protein